MALNAIVRTAHLRESGGPLEVLAHEVKGSSSVATETVTQIDDLVAMVEDLAGKLDATETVAATARHRRNHERGMAELSAAYDRFTAGFAEAFSLAQSLLKTTGDLHAGVGFLNPLMMDQHREAFREEAFELLAKVFGGAAGIRTICPPVFWNLDTGNISDFPDTMAGTFPTIRTPAPAAGLRTTAAMPPPASPPPSADHHQRSIISSIRPVTGHPSRRHRAPA
ncbi:MAG: hypothetical protein JW781_05870 [Deltaproteobacteria bacterium]|nr:hypothetical protein [Candidatus Anaeroferrophillacea bacterium]